MIPATLKKRLAGGAVKFINDTVAGKPTDQTPAEFAEEIHKLIEAGSRAINILVKLDLARADHGLDLTQFEALKAWAKAEPTPETYKHHFRTSATPVQPVKKAKIKK